MGNDTKGLFLMFMSCCLFMFACSFSPQKALASDSVQEINREDKGTYVHGTADVSIGGNRRKDVTSSGKIARGAGFGGVAGGGGSSGTAGSAGSGSTENGGRSGSGGALIPVYAAGANNNRHQKTHHGSSNRSLNSVGLCCIIMSILLSLAFTFSTG